MGCSPYKDGSVLSKANAIFLLPSFSKRSASAKCILIHLAVRTGLKVSGMPKGATCWADAFLIGRSPTMPFSGVTSSIRTSNERSQSSARSPTLNAQPSSLTNCFRSGKFEMILNGVPFCASMLRGGPISGSAFRDAKCTLLADANPYVL